jgi:type IV secretion system protein VirB4
MFRLQHALKSYHYAGSLNEQINLFGFLDDHAFLTKSGDIGIMLAVSGVDYECLSAAEIDHFTKRLESAFKTFDAKCRVYQYLFKRNHETIPY